MKDEEREARAKDQFNPCPHNWIPCEWEYDYTYSSKDMYGSDFAVNSSDNIPYDVRRLTKLYCTLCDTRKQTTN